MTREELKQIADTVRSCIVETDKNSHTNAVLSGVANGIEKMDVEPCEDAVSREAVLEQTYNWSKDEFLRVTNPFDYLRKRINSLPSVTPTCSENPNNCEDAISRQAAQDYIAKYLSQYLYNDVREAVEVIDEYIGELPPVTPKQKMGRWIPVSERLPDIHNYTKHYLVTLKRGGVFVAMFTETDGNSWWTYDDVIAWMPLPEPYMSENPTGSNCTDCVLDGTDACSRGAGRAVDGRVCEDFVGESED